MDKNAKQKRARKSTNNKQKDPIAHKKPREEPNNNEDAVDTELYEVEDIIDCKLNGKEVVYKVRWVGYSPEYDSFEPEFRLMCPAKIKGFALKKFNFSYSNTDINMVIRDFEGYHDDLFIESANYLAIIGKRFYERGSLSYIEHNTISANKRFLKSMKNFENEWYFYTLDKDKDSFENDMKLYIKDIESRIQASDDHPLVRIFYKSSNDKTTPPPPNKNITFDLLHPDELPIIQSTQKGFDGLYPFVHKDANLNSRWDFLNDPIRKSIKLKNKFKNNLSLRCSEEAGWKLWSDHFVEKGSAILQMAGEICDESVAHNSMRTDGFPIAISSIFKIEQTGKVLDQRNRYDFSRFISHSCEPNCVINVETSATNQFRVDGKFVPRLIVTNCVDLGVNGEVLTMDFFKMFTTDVNKFFAKIRDPLIEEENGRLAYLIENGINFVHCSCGSDICRQILFIEIPMIGKTEKDRETVYNNMPNNSRFKGTTL